jgi:oxygen-dependent protoporphyrinogen oxidase
MPAPEAARILDDSGLNASEELSSVRYNPMTVAHMAFRKKGPDEFKGFGGLVPAAANFKTAGAIWTSSVFHHRQPDDFHLLAAFYGGALRPESASLTKEDTESVLQEENIVLYGRSADYFLNVEQWKEGIPQYDQARRDAENAVKELSAQRLYFLANWKGGIGLSDCIRNAARLAEILKSPV